MLKTLYAWYHGVMGAHIPDTRGCLEAKTVSTSFDYIQMPPDKRQIMFEAHGGNSSRQMTVVYPYAPRNANSTSFFVKKTRRGKEVSWIKMTCGSSGLLFLLYKYLALCKWHVSPQRMASPRVFCLSSAQKWARAEVVAG